MAYLCDLCGGTFSREWSLEKHVKQIHEFSYLCDLCGFETNDKQTSTIHKKQHTEEYFQCEQCNKNLKCRKSLLRHVRDQHEIKRFSCSQCNYKTNRAYLLSEHKKTHIEKPQVSEPSLKRVKSNEIQNSKTVSQPAQQDEAAQQDGSTQQDEVVRSAFRGKIQERVWNIRGCTDPLGALHKYKHRIRDAILLSLKKNPQNFWIAVKVRFFQVDKNGYKTEDSAFFHGSMHTVLRREDFEEAFQTSLKKIWNSFDIYLKNGSGWILERVEIFLLNTYDYTPINVGSYIPTPEAIATKKAVINVQNKNDNKCFEYSVLAALLHKEIKHHAERRYQYKDYLGKRLKSCKESMRIDDIPHFESKNDISIAVYRIKHNGKKVFPLYMTKRRKADPINLLLIEGEDHSHYAWIKDFNRLLGSSNKKANTKLFCPYCCYGFVKKRNGKNNLAEHKNFCRPYGAQRTKFLPKEANFIQFNDYEKMQKLPFCIYADFETINKDVEEKNFVIDYGENGEPLKSGTELKTNHAVTGFTFCTVSPHFPINTVTYRNPDAGKVFLEMIHEEKERILKQWKDSGSEKMNMTSKDEYQFKRTTCCHICTQKFVENPTKKGQTKVRDHDHFTGDYRGAAHSKCNIAMRTVKNIPIFFHNLGGYDSHIIFNNLNKVPIETPSVIAKAIERFVCFRIGKLYFKDSLQFLASSLEKLSQNLAAKAVHGKTLEDVFPNLHSYFMKKWSHLPPQAFKMLTRKGVYPYSYMNDFEKFKETCLPPREKFYNDLSKKHISDGDYTFIHELWNTYNLKNLGELHDLYMETDVLILSDVFEEFRNFSLLKYRLDPAHYNTAPGLSWSAALLYTKQRLEIPIDPNMHLFFDKGLTGGASQVANPFAQANHEGMKEKFDPEVMRAYIAMFDCNNQYGWAMSQYLPTHGFNWVKLDTECSQFWTNFVLQQEDCQDTGYFFEVDLEYPEELHNTHDQYPLAPEHLEIKEEMLSDSQKELAKDLNVKVGGSKLCLTLLDKKGYICHYRNLKFYLQKGLKIKKVRRVLEFQQSPWIKSYIELNTRLRQEAQNKFEQNFAKLMNNSFFGKTCEDVRKYKDFKIALTEKRVTKLINKTTCKRSKLYEENLVTFQLQRETVTMNKPRYIGQAILDISKTVMYKFHYDFIMKHFPETELLFTDTDSFCYFIPTEKDLYGYIKGNTEWFDFSNYPEDHPNFDTSNYLIPGKFKDEMGGFFIEEFCGLRSKMYSILKFGGGEKKAANGVLEQVKNDEITHEDYKNCLMKRKATLHEGTKIFQKKHQLYTATMVKKTLNPYNDKKYISYEDGEFTCFSYGHYKIDIHRFI
jgi:hypothetical protein